MSTLRLQTDEDAVANLPGFPPPRRRSRGRRSRDLRHCIAAHSCRDNDRAPALLAAAKMRDRTTAPVVLMGADQSALEQGGEDLA